MKTRNRTRKLLSMVVSTVFVAVIAIVGFSYASQIDIWATDPTGSYPTVLATPNWVLIGTTFGENFEEGYTGQQTLEDFLLDSILTISSSTKPTVAVYSGGDSGDVGGMQNVMNKFVNQGYIASFSLVVVNPSNPMNVDLSTLSQYDVVVLDPPTCKGSSWQFIVTDSSRLALSQYLSEGGKIVASAYLFVNWTAYTSWVRELYNEELGTLFWGAKPDILTYYPSAVTTSPFSQGESVATYNAIYPGGPDDPYFHSFWKLELPLCVQPPAGLVAWWPLDETDGAPAADIVGDNDGTHVNGPIPVEGKVAGALRFDGINDYVNLGSNSSLNIPGSITIDAWVKIIGDEIRWYNYFVADFDSTGWVSQLSLGVYSVGGKFQFYSYEGSPSGDNTYVRSSADKTVGQWYHVAVVRDDDFKTIKLYVNGSLEGSGVYTGEIPVLQGNKYLGSSGSTWGDYFNGELDEVEIYNRALSALEIQAIFKAGSAGKCKGVVVNQPPVAQCKDVSVAADSVCTAAASIDNGSYDPDGDPITLTQSPLGSYPLGDTLVSLSVFDDQGASSQCTGTVTVVDNAPPTITSISVSPSVLWPPNHKMVPVNVTATASDNCAVKKCNIISVTSNEPVKGLGDGDTAPDWNISGNVTVDLRAERSGPGSSRVYTITVECADSAGNSSTGTVGVTVPHDQGKK